MPLQSPIATHYSSFSLSAYFLFANGCAFLTSKSAKVDLIRFKSHKTRGMKGIIDMVNEIRQIYSSRGFKLIISTRIMNSIRKK